MSTETTITRDTLVPRLKQYCTANKELADLVRAVIALGVRAERERDDLRIEIARLQRVNAATVLQLHAYFDEAERLRGLVAAGVGPDSTRQDAMALVREAHAIRTMNEPMPRAPLPPRLPVNQPVTV